MSFLLLFFYKALYGEIGSLFLHSPVLDLYGWHKIKTFFVCESKEKGSDDQTEEINVIFNIIYLTALGEKVIVKVH